MQLLKELFEGVQCDSDLFKLYVSEDKYIMGYMSADRYYNPDKSFLVYKTLYIRSLIWIENQKVI